MCATYAFPLILYRLSVLLLCQDHRKATECLLASLLYVGGQHNVCIVACVQRLCHRGFDLSCLSLPYYHSPVSKAEYQCKTFFKECRESMKAISRFIELSGPSKFLYLSFVKGVASSTLLEAKLVGGQFALFLDLGAIGNLSQQPQIFTYLEIDSEPDSSQWRKLQMCLG